MARGLWPATDTTRGPQPAARLKKGSGGGCGGGAAPQLQPQCLYQRLSEVVKRSICVLFLLAGCDWEANLCGLGRLGMPGEVFSCVN